MSDSATADSARADEAAEAEASHDVPAVAGVHRTRGFRRALHTGLIAWVIAAFAIFAAVWFALQAQDLRSRETARAEALEAGEIVALQLTTFTGAGIDEWVEETKTLATGTFAADLTRQYDQRLRADLREFQVESVGEVINSFVQEIDGDEALVFVVLRQTTRYPTFNRAVEDEVRFEIALQRTDGQWLASDAKLLSPTPALQPRPFLEQQQGDG